MPGCRTFSGIAGSWLLSWAIGTLPAAAQIAGDGTLGTQVNGSEIAPCTGVCIITDGAARGSNLFHSFRQFSLPNGDVAGFQIAPTIQNVIVRVTGVGQPFISNINGTIATSNSANFFLLNPNGIVFGPGATLNIGGSFLATTANRIQFQDGTQFSTTEPTPLLTISVPIGLQFGQAPGSIQARRVRLLAGQTDNFGDIALVGGDITLDNSVIQTPGRRITLSGMGENGAAGLDLTGDRLSLSQAASTPRRDITLTNGSRINAISSNGGSDVGGDVVVTGQTIVLNKSSIFAGMGVNNTATHQAGDITIDATADLQLTQGSKIINGVSQNAIGQGGNTIVTAAQIRVHDGSAIDTVTLGNGNAGNVEVKTGSLTVTNGSEISSATSNNGNAGNVQIIANAIALDRAGNISSLVQSIGSARGRGGDVTVETDSLTATNGAGISAGTFGNGDAGNVHVIANTITLDGIIPGGQSSSGIGSQTEGPSRARGGNIKVETHSLTVTNGAIITASTFGNGDAGNVQVIADTITLDGNSPVSISGIGSQVARTSNGRGGDITLETDSLTITNGAIVSAGTFGNGDAGNVRVTANTITLDGTAPDGQSSFSSIDNEVFDTGRGRGGDITIKVGSLTVTNGARIAASTFGDGDAGKVRVTADTIILDGTAPDSRNKQSGIASQVGFTGNGRGGDITVEAGSLTLTNAIISSDARNGSAGNLDITARILRLDRSDISAQSASGNGANINLTIGNLLLMRNNSQISTSAGLAGTGGNGGNITINALRGFLVTAPNENNDITANAFNGSGGGVTINAQGIYGFTPRSRADLARLLGTNDPAQLDPRRLPTNDITAISQGNPDLSGTVTLNVLNIDPSRGLLQLPLDLADPSGLISQECSPTSKSAASSFVITGQGSLPPNPTNLLSGATVLVNLAGATGEQAEQRNQDEAQQSEIHKPQATIIEAKSWVVAPDGSVRLVAAVPAAPTEIGIRFPLCPQR